MTRARTLCAPRVSASSRAAAAAAQPNCVLRQSAARGRDPIYFSNTTKLGGDVDVAAVEAQTCAHPALFALVEAPVRVRRETVEVGERARAKKDLPRALPAPQHHLHWR